jgi:hypothetical protein
MIENGAKHILRDIILFALTWIDFPIRRHTIGVNNILEDLRELVSWIKRWWRLNCVHDVDNW